MYISQSYSQPSTAKGIVVFDIDGTLIHPLPMEGDVFLRAMRDVFDDQVPHSVDWENYRYCTDSGIFFEITHALYGRAPSAHEISAMQTHCLHRFNTAKNQQSAACVPIPGADSIFAYLCSHGWDIAIATGCWHALAHWKLSRAGLFQPDIPLACSDDHHDRADIIRLAIQKAQAHYGKSAYATIVYVGDRAWDKRAADKIPMHFIGLGDYWEPHTDIMQIPHYADTHTAQFLHHLNDIAQQQAHHGT